MFQKCTAIEKIDIPSKVSLIAGSAFAECSSLVEAVFESSANWIYVANKLDIAGTTVDFTDAAIAASTLTNSDYYNGFFRRVGG